MERIILVRHGETRMNTSPEMIRGWKDVPLDAHGKEQSREVAKAISKHTLASRIFTSDLDRAVTTADMLSTQLKVPVEKMKELRPWNVGSYAGVELTPELRKKVAALVINSSKKAPDGESFSEFIHRLKKAIDKITHAALTSNLPVVAVSHTRVIRVFLTWIESGMSGIFRQPPSTWLAKDEDPVKPGQYIELTWKRGRWTAGEAK